MKGERLTGKQLKAAEQYILLRRAAGNDVHPEPDRAVTLTWWNIVTLVAEYGAIRAGSMANGGSVEEPGEVYITGK